MPMSNADAADGPPRRIRYYGFVDLVTSTIIGPRTLEQFNVLPREPDSADELPDGKEVRHED